VIQTNVLSIFSLVLGSPDGGSEGPKHVGGYTAKLVKEVLG
jgi:hypothetical protein